jgi:hypothetical protein
MQKAFLISILAGTMLIPFAVARGGSLKNAVRRSVIATVVFCFLYWIGLVVVYPMLPSANRAIGGNIGARQ